MSRDVIACCGRKREISIPVTEEILILKYYKSIHDSKNVATARSDTPSQNCVNLTVMLFFIFLILICKNNYITLHLADAFIQSDLQ